MKLFLRLLFDATADKKRIVLRIKESFQYPNLDTKLINIDGNRLAQNSIGRNRTCH